MIYRFVIISREVKDFRRDLRISGSSTFLQLHSALMEALGYDPKEPSLFRITDNRWNPTQDVYLYDMGSFDSDEDVFLMKDTYLDQFLDAAGQRLLLTFDLLGDRSFYIELREITLGADLEAPEISRSEGHPPAQTTAIEDLLTTSNPAVTLAGVSGSGSDANADDLDYRSDEEGLNEEDLADFDITSEDEL